MNFNYIRRAFCVLRSFLSILAFSTVTLFHSVVFNILNMDFYYSPVSGPCRAVMMTAEALGIKLNKKFLNLRTGEHLNPEFLAINPQHTVPTLVDDGFVLWESRAIMIYLVEKYGKEDDPLYPKCPKKRAIINQRLYFDMGTLHSSYREFYYPILKLKAQPDPEKFKKVEAAFELLDTFLDCQTYAAGEEITLADISLMSNVSTFIISGFQITNYNNIMRWYSKCENTMAGVEENWKGCLARHEYFK